MKRGRSIQFRIMSGLALILIGGIGVSIILTTANQRANLLDATQRTLAVNNEMLNATIRNIMLSGEAPVANRTLEDFRNITGFLEFELYRTDGTVAFNDYDTLDFVNGYQDMISFEQTPRQDSRLIDSEGFYRAIRNKSPVILRNDNIREMEYFFPILNYADCRVCHGDEPFVRGVSHFRVSLEGIFNQVSRAGTILTGYFVAVGIILFSWIIILMRRTIISPVLRIGETVNIAATGNLDVSVEMERSDEVGELAGRVNAMITGLRERRELELQNRMIETRLEENRKYLDNIKEGLLLLNTERRITGQFSVFLTRLFGQSEIAGLTLVDFIYPDAAKYESERSDLDGFLDMLYTNRTADMDMLMTINPLDEVILEVSERKRIVVRADFLRIYSGSDIENVMVIFEDLTDIVHTREELEEQRLRRESELEQIAAVLKLGPQAFEGFIYEAQRTIGDLRANITRLDDRDYVAGAFRNIHSVKGTARYLDVPKVEEYSHALEDLMAAMRDGTREAGGEVETEAAELLESLEREIDLVRRLINRFKEFTVRGTGTPATPFEIFSDRLSSMVADLSSELGKEVEFSLESELSEVPGLAAVQPSIFHLIRNALDHGLEDSFQRLAEGKDSKSRLVLRIEENDSWLKVEVEDDGRGIDFDALEKRGVESGLLKPGRHLPSQIINMLFRSGFSARDEATNISGRGVGLDAVKDDIRKLGGRINVKTARGRGTTFVLSIPADGGGK